MKTTIVFIILLAILSLNNDISAQISEQTTKGSVYVIDKKKGKISNKNSAYDKLLKEVKQCEYYKIKESKPSISEIVKNVFPPKRIQFLASKKNTIAFSFICNRTGDVLALYFLPIYDSFVTLSELELFENAFMRQKIVIETTCLDNKYFKFFQVIHFDQCL